MLLLNCATIEDPFKKKVLQFHLNLAINFESIWMCRHIYVVVLLTLLSFAERGREKKQKKNKLHTKESNTLCGATNPNVSPLRTRKHVFCRFMTPANAFFHLKSNILSANLLVNLLKYQQCNKWWSHVFNIRLIHRCNRTDCIYSANYELWDHVRCMQSTEKIFFHHLPKNIKYKNHAFKKKKKKWGCEINCTKTLDEIWWFLKLLNKSMYNFPYDRFQFQNENIYRQNLEISI